MSTILVIDDDPEIRYSLHRVLQTKGYTIETAATGETGIELAQRLDPKVILLDIRMEGMSGLEALQHVRSESPRSMVILMTAFGTTQTAIEAMKYGAFDYVVKPFELERLLALIDSALQASQDLRGTSQESYQPILNSEDYQEGMVGRSPAMQEVFKSIGKVSESEVTVLVTGESGTGKELVARSIHQHSNRAHSPYIAVNCAAIPEQLIESELFGHEKGAFTGAHKQHIGKFEHSDGGTLFLDEIGDMTLPTQTRILRVLQEGEIQRVGGSDTLKVDVRIIAATNKDIEQMVTKANFREDLYYRLNVVRIHLPNLRDRSEDIPELVDFILQKMARERKTSAQKISSSALQALQNHHWTGNVRELENAVYRAAVVAKGETILLKDLPQNLHERFDKKSFEAIQNECSPSSVPEPVEVAHESPENKSKNSTNHPDSQASYEFDTKPLDAEEAISIVYHHIRQNHDKMILQEFEKKVIELALKECNDNQVKTAALLGVTRTTLRKRIEQYYIEIK